MKHVLDLKITTFEAIPLAHALQRAIESKRTNGKDREPLRWVYNRLAQLIVEANQEEMSTSEMVDQIWK